MDREMASATVSSHQRKSGSLSPDSTVPMEGVRRDDGPVGIHIVGWLEGPCIGNSSV